MILNVVLYGCENSSLALEGGGGHRRRVSEKGVVRIFGFRIDVTKGWIKLIMRSFIISAPRKTF
jgi:hypothetical protein